MTKQTAVEWLIEQFSKHYAIHQLEDEINKAKEMEKEQIIDAHYAEEQDAEQYYNETFKQQ